ncbi:MAG: hypothetical protein AAF545_14745 [Pseudomonadota bacterium]
MRILAIAVFVLFALEGTALADPKSEVEELMNTSTGLAEQMLREHGEFYPYGAAMTPDGDIVSVSAHTGGEHPPSQELIDLLKGAFRDAAQGGEYKATALIYDVRVSTPPNGVVSDVIAVALDHKDEYSVVVFLPYKLTDGDLEFSPVFAQAGANVVFQN